MAPTSAPAPATVEDEDDDDLDDLLDEFDEQILSKPPGADAPSETTTTTKAPSREPLNDEITHNIEDLVKDLNIEDPETKLQFEQLVKQFETTHKEDAQRAQDPQNFDAVMKETMERLKKSGENIDEQLKNDPSASNPEDMLTQLLSGLGGGAGGTGDSGFDMTKLLADMLEQLSSKEILYEPIKELNTKFPEYLADKKGKIPDSQHENYTKQYEVTEKIVALFEGPEYDQEDLAKKEEINALLETLQELGNPPTELVGDDSSFPGLGGPSGPAGLDFNSKDLPQDLEKELEEGCKQT